MELLKDLMEIKKGLDAFQDMLGIIVEEDVEAAN